jgi:hypothetical protein
MQNRKNNFIVTPISDTIICVCFLSVIVVMAQDDGKRNKT